MRSHLTSNFVFPILLSVPAFAQDDFLAKQYFQDGDFDKAVVFYEKLVSKNPRRTDYSEALGGLLPTIGTLMKRLSNLSFEERLKHPFVFPTFLYRAGVQLHPTTTNLKKLGNLLSIKPSEKIEENPNFGYSVGYRFQKYALLDQAISAYTRSMELKPELNYNFQLARIYGEQGKIEKMYQSYLQLVYEGKTPRSNVLRQLNDFISEDPNNKNNLLLRKTLLQNAQKNPDIIWNEMLSWLFIQQNQYNSSFSQEKAIFKRSNGASQERLRNLGEIAFENKDLETAENVFKFLASNAKQPEATLNAELRRIDISLLNTKENGYTSIQKKFEELLETYGYQPATIQLQIAFANFFNL